LFFYRIKNIHYNENKLLGGSIMNKNILLKTLGTICALGGAVLTVLGNWVDDEKMKEEVKECVRLELEASNNDSEDE
jgi:hypothetical protein